VALKRGVDRVHVDLESLLRRRDSKVIPACLGATVLILIGVTLLLPPGGKHEEERLLPTKFVKRPPMSTRPLQLRKRIVPRTRPISRPKLSFGRPQVPGMGGWPAGGPDLPAKAMPGPGVRPSRRVAFGSSRVGRGAAPGEVAIDRYGRGWRDLRLALLDVDAMDFGRYRGLVVVDPEDKKEIKGFLKLATVYVESMMESPFWDATGRLSTAREDLSTRALQNLAEAMNEYTHVRTEVLDPIPITDERLYEVPFVLISAERAFRWTDAEARSLGRYLLSGGFAYVEDAGWGLRTSSGPPLREFVREALRSQGLVEFKDWRFEVLEEDHPVLHCFFDFEGLPVGFYETGHNYLGISRELTWQGVRIGGRWVLIFSEKDYRDWWARRNELEGWRRPGCEGKGLERYYQLGVNLLVFALTQEGGIAERYVARR